MKIGNKSGQAAETGYQETLQEIWKIRDSLGLLAVRIQLVLRAGLWQSKEKL